MNISSGGLRHQVVSNFGAEKYESPTDEMEFSRRWFYLVALDMHLGIS
jgi:hypothetical protein